MLTALIEVIVSVLIANFEAKNHPYFVNFMKGIIAGLFMFIFAISKTYLLDGYVSFSKIQFGFIVSLTVGIILSFILMFLTFLEQPKKD